MRKQAIFFVGFFGLNKKTRALEARVFPEETLKAVAQAQRIRSGMTQNRVP